MCKKDIPIILLKSLNELDFSIELNSAINPNFANLKEFLELKTHQMLKIDGFGYRELKELYQFLESNNCESFIKEI